MATLRRPRGHRATAATCGEPYGLGGPPMAPFGYFESAARRPAVVASACGQDSYGVAELPTGVVTLLFTDVEGSTRLLNDLGAEAYAGALAEHRRLLRAIFVRYGGVEVDTQGDAFFYAFPSAS